MDSIYYDMLLVLIKASLFCKGLTFYQACWKKLFVWEIMGEIQRGLGDAGELTSKLSAGELTSKLSLSYINQPNTCISITE